MSSLLYVKASPRGGRSHSLAVADAFAAAWRDANPGATVTTKNLFDAELPAFDGFVIQAKYNIMHGREHSLTEREAWGRVEEIIDEFKAHDRYLFAVPMWNFSIPYILKQYIDIIAQPGLTFGMKADGSYFGMLEKRRAAVVYARGGVYTPGTPAEGYNHQSPYLEMILGFMGVTDVRSVAVEGALMGPDVRDAARAVAMEKVRDLVAEF
ncbi:FMN-dependent NADH-azoreductase [Desulfobaculum xiamenense]|uniref:FMN dependent NADH:quinone oxidoreductase n=1 Tax=Desulfobaculum xiamenense TaxID=995050 RepID=A0A846QQC5_9BACT|nr:NAD(P)H-dependent oxidoreductase [Desulfobaculum xiamenense]NJB69377.1 FMN-dependent NADH-azoreductase [Desulfobaculum xiamenense]